MEECCSKVSADDLAFDVDAEIPNSSDVHLVAKYAEREKERLAAESVYSIPQETAPPQRVIMESVPGDNESSDEEVVDEVKQWCRTAGKGGVLAKKTDVDGSVDDFLDDCEKDGEKDGEKDDERGEKNEEKKTEAQAEKRPAKKEKEPPTINLQAPERIDEKEKLDHVGYIHSFIEGTIVVRGVENSKALDLQSLLCFEDRVTLGVVCDTFGSVKEPHYLIYVTAPEVVQRVHGELTTLEGKKVFAVESESTFALAEEELSKALAGLSFMQPLEDDSTDDMSDDSP